MSGPHVPSAEAGPRALCTYFGRHFLPRGLALHDSLTAHCPAFRLTILCLDDETHAALRGLELAHVRLVALEELERADPALADVKASRSVRGYMSTLRPAFLRHLLVALDEDAALTYLDADLYCFADPTPAIDALGGHSICVTPHRYLPRLRGLEAIHGRYNAGWLGVRNDAAGRACLGWWREQCLESCELDPSGPSFGNQRYLDAWPARFDGVLELDDPGVNNGPWRFVPEQFEVRDGAPFVAGRPLRVYHFSGLRHVRGRVYRPGLAHFGTPITPAVSAALHVPYVRALMRARDRLPGAPPLLGSITDAPRAAGPLRAWVHGLRDRARLRRGWAFEVP